MCLGVPGRVVEVLENMALVDLFAVSRQLRLKLTVSGRTGEGIHAWVNWLCEQEIHVAPGQPAASSACR